MTKQEFENRCINVSYIEFETINNAYMSCELDKDAFCALWNKANRERVNEYRKVVKELNEATELSYNVSNYIRYGVKNTNVDKLIKQLYTTKAHYYINSDFEYFKKYLSTSILFDELDIIDMQIKQLVRQRDELINKYAN